MFTWWIEPCAAYLRERYPARLFIPLALLVTAVGSGAGQHNRAFIVAVSALAAWLCLLAFRIADDFADRDADRIKAPGRVMVRATDRRPFGILAAGTFIAGLALLAFVHGSPGVWPTAAMALALLGWYVARRRIPAHGRLNALIVMAKYPAIAWSVAGTMAPPIAAHVALLAVLYASALTFEFAHDPATAPSCSLWTPVLCAIAALGAMLVSVPTGGWLVAGFAVCGALLAGFIARWPRAWPMPAVVALWTPALVAAAPAWIKAF